MNSSIARALAKVLAHIAVGNREEASRWTVVLVSLLREAGVPVITDHHHDNWSEHG